MKSLLLCMCMLFSMNVLADQGDQVSDEEFYSHPENRELHESEFYYPFDDGAGHIVHLKTLPRSSFDKHDPNFWRWFDKYPCMYDLGYHEDTCKNPPYNEKKKLPDDFERCDDDHHPAPVPEPETLILLSVGFIGLLINYRRNK